MLVRKGRFEAFEAQVRDWFKVSKQTNNDDHMGMREVLSYQSKKISDLEGEVAKLREKLRCIGELLVRY